MRLLLGIPTRGDPTKEFLASLAALRLPAACNAFEHYTVTGDFVPGQRELIARRAVTLAADYLVMLDDDMVVPPDAIERLTAILDGDPQAAVAGALYYSRDGIRPMIVAGWSSTDTTTAWIPAFTTIPLRVDGVGFGCVALRVSALNALRPPLFGAHVYIEESAARVRLCNEDYLLCERLREAGYAIVLHPGVRCGHVDRRTQRIIPERWEDPAVTNRRRMIVVDPGPRFSVVDYDPSVGRQRERHDDARLTYLSVE